MSRVPLIVAITSVSTLLVACGPRGVDYPAPIGAPVSSPGGTSAASAPEPSAYPAPTEATTVEPAAFEDRDWQLVPSGDPVDFQQTTITVTARFDSVAVSVGGSSGCNSYSAAYQHSGPSLQIEQARTTLMACDPGPMEVERAYLGLLSKITAWDVTADQLTLSAEDGSVLIYAPAKGIQQ